HRITFHNGRVKSFPDPKRLYDLIAFGLEPIAVFRRFAAVKLQCMDMTKLSNVHNRAELGIDKYADRGHKRRQRCDNFLNLKRPYVAGALFMKYKTDGPSA